MGVITLLAFMNVFTWICHGWIISPALCETVCICVDVGTFCFSYTELGFMILLSLLSDDQTMVYKFIERIKLTISFSVLYLGDFPAEATELEGNS